MCWMGLCVVFGLKFGLFVIARFRKLRGTNDNGWFCGRGGNCGAVVLLLYYYVLRRTCSVLSLFLCYILLFVRLGVFCLLRMKKFQKILQTVCVLHLLVYLLVCV